VANGPIAAEACYNSTGDLMKCRNDNRWIDRAWQVGLLLALLCAAGLPGVAAARFHPLLVTTATLGPAGGEVRVPAPHAIRLALPAQSLLTETSVILRLFNANALAVPNTDVAGSSETLQVEGLGTLADTGTLTITAPYRGAVDARVDFAVVTDHAGHYLPLQPVFDVKAHTFCLTLSHADFTFFAVGHAANAPLPSVWSVGLKHVVRRLDTPYARLKEFGWSPETPPRMGSWECWKPFSSPDTTPQRTAIVLHGAGDTLADMNALAFYLARLRARDGTRYYARVYGVDYHWQAHIAGNGTLVAAMWKSAFPADDRRRVDIFAHSMGGLVARWAIEQAGADRGIHRLFTLATPHNGLPLYHLARCTLIAPFVLNLAFPGIADLLQNKDPRSFINRINQPTPPVAAAYFTFAGAHWQGFLGPIGATMRTIYSADCVFDGIVPAASAQSSVLAGKCAAWIHPPAWNDFDHKAMRGKYQHGDFNFDTPAGTAPTQEAPSSPPRLFRDYILEEDGVTTP